LALAAPLAPAARAEVKLDPLLTDHAVLQRGVPIPVWGPGDPGEAVTVDFQILARGATVSAKTTAGNDGRWMVKLPAQTPGGSFTMVVQGKNKVEIKDLLIGEVWVCSGQSNMEWRLQRAAEAQPAIDNATNPQIRLFTVARTAVPEPQPVVKGEWKECTPQTAAAFSAVGYFFGRDLQKALNVPIGLIHTSWGGTPAQAWTSAETLQADPALKGMYDGLVKAREGYPAAQEAYKAAAAKATEAGQPAPKP